VISVVTACLNGVIHDIVFKLQAPSGGIVPAFRQPLRLSSFSLSRRTSALESHDSPRQAMFEYRAPSDEQDQREQYEE